jgi:hypothetical protein
MIRTARRWDVVTIIAAAVLALGTAQLFAGARAVGVTTDEPTHTLRLISWIETGWYVAPGELKDGKPDPSKDVLSSPYVYGPALSLTAHAANIVAGNEGRGQVSRTAGAYAVRHSIVALLALLATLAAGLAVWALTRSRRFGLWAAAGLLAVPAWMGHGFFNLKDTPAAAGYTFVTVGLLLALRRSDDERRDGWMPVAIGALLAGGVFIGAGTRLALWAPFLASFCTYAALRLGQRRLGKFAPDRATDLVVAGGGLVGVLAVAAAYPKVAVHPVALLVESISGAVAYPNYTATLTAGHLLGFHPPLWYLPAHVAASYPLILGALGAAGAVLGVRALVNAWRERPRRAAFWRRDDLGLLLVLQQTLLLPILTVAGGAVMYDGIRQHLYVIPAIAILAGLGAARLGNWAGRPGAKPTRGVLTKTVLALALLVPMTEQTILFPYNYVYVNPLAGIGGVEGNWETDYWQASWPEALSHIPLDVNLRCAYELVPPGEPTDVPLRSIPCPGEQLDPFSDRRGTDTEAEPAREPPALWAIGHKRARNRPPDTCEQVDNVTRWLRGETVTMSYVLRCPYDRARTQKGSVSTTSASRGAPLSRSLSRGSASGHSTPMSESSQAIPASLAGS